MKKQEAPEFWKCRDDELPVGGFPLIMGILNLTPDSFSDGGKYKTVAAAVKAGVRMEEDGANIIDVGAVSTRPGSTPPSTEEELARLIPVVRKLRKQLCGATLSVDTFRAEVAQAALDEGADIINDVYAMRYDKDPKAMATVVAKYGAGLVLTHMAGTPQTMQDIDHKYKNVVTDVRDFLVERAIFARQCGVKRECLMLDPGIGFGKGMTDNFQLIGAGVEALREAGYPVLIGLSRKQFMGSLDGNDNPATRDIKTLAANFMAWNSGADIWRVHNVHMHYEACCMIGMTHMAKMAQGMDIFGGFFNE